MAAYSALVSLQQLLNSDEFTLHYPKPLLESLRAKLSLLQSFSEKVFPASQRGISRANKLEAQIRDAVYKAQDFIETFTNKTLPSETLQEIIENIDPIIKEAESLAANIRGQDEDEEVKTLAGVERILPVGTPIVGQDEDKKIIVDQLQSDDDKRLVIPVTGMPGVGKTTLATSIYEDLEIMDLFPYRAWVTVSQHDNVGDIFAKLLTSIESGGRKAGERVYEGSESSLMEKLYQVLYSRRYLLVIDDMWDEEVWYKLQLALPDNENRSRVVVTTRLRGVAESITSSGFIHEVRPLGNEASWTLLKLRTLGDAPCPDHLEGVGREIATNCKGLPSLITLIGNLLSRERKVEEYWRSIAQDTYAASSGMVIEEAYREILYLSYQHLPPELKACFLHMAAFPEDTEISVSKLIKLWVAEGFLTPPQPPQTIERVAENSLTMLIDRNLISICRNSSDGRIKTCRMHDSLLELAKEEAEKEKFFYSIATSQTEKIKEGATCQRRVSVHDTILMCRKQVYHSTKSIKYARSLLYVDPHYHYPLPFCLTFDLLRVLDAYTVYHIEFPNEYIELIHLRYLSLTYNGKLPPSISKLKNLQVLIVRRQPKIIVVGISFLPEEIWD